MNQQRNPYVGPRVFAYEDRDYFFGRDREARELLARVMSQRLVLFYAQSGAGKSSLIHARLVPELREAGFAVLPVGRVGGEMPVGPDGADNIYLYNLMLSLDQGPGQPNRLARLGLTDFLKGLVSEDGLQYEYDPSVEPEVDEAADSYTAVPYVLIIDQFEELITTYPDRWPEREDFFRQLNQAMLDDPDLWVVLTLREDYLAALDPFALLMRDRLRARFYMQRMGASAACDAIIKPAAKAGRPFAPGVAEALVDDLRQVQLQRPDGTTFSELGPYVEPVQLQVVCYRLWENLSPEAAEISKAELLSVGDVNQSLADYYADRVAVVHIKSGISERAIRNWIEKRLITSTGMRDQVLMEPEESAGLANEAIRLLQNAHLVRAEKRSGATWFELAHDRLVEPVRQNNATWRQAKLSLLQRQAALWAEQNRPEGLLLRGAALDGAESWASDHANDMSPLDVEFLELSRERRTRNEEARAQERKELEMARDLAVAEKERADAEARIGVRTRRLVAILAFLLLIAIIAASYALNQQGKAAANAEQAENSEATALAAMMAVENAATAEANAETAVDNAATAAANTELALTREAEALATGTVAAANAAEAQSLRLAFASQSIGPANPTLALLLAIQAGQVADTPEARDALRSALAAPGIEELLLLHESPVTQASWNEAGSQILTNSRDGSTRVWDAESGEALPDRQDEGGFSQANWNKVGLHTFSYELQGNQVHDSNAWDYQATALSDGQVTLAYKYTGFHAWYRVVVFLEAYVTHEGDSTFVTLHDEGPVNCCSPPSGGFDYSGLHTFSVQAGDTVGFRFGGRNFDTDDRLFGTLQVVGSDLSWRGGGPGTVDEESRYLTTNDTMARVSDPSGLTLLVLEHQDEVNQASWNRDGSRILTASADGTARVWDAESGQELFVLRHEDGINQARWSRDGSQILTASDDGTARVWDALGQPMVSADTKELIEKACQRLGRTLPLTEWLEYHSSGEDWGLDPALVEETCKPFQA